MIKHFRCWSSRLGVTNNKLGNDGILDLLLCSRVAKH